MTYLVGQDAVVAISNMGHPAGVELCIVCRKPHGGINERFACLKAEIVRLRNVVEAKDRELADMSRRQRGK